MGVWVYGCMDVPDLGRVYPTHITKPSKNDKQTTNKRQTNDKQTTKNDKKNTTNPATAFEGRVFSYNVASFFEDADGDKLNFTSVSPFPAGSGLSLSSIGIVTGRELGGVGW